MTLINGAQFLDMLAKNKPAPATEQVIPVNAKTGLPYQGSNIAALQEAAAKQGFTSTQWATLKQWNMLNERVRKGEKGTMIAYFDTQGENRG